MNEANVKLLVDLLDVDVCFEIRHSLKARFDVVWRRARLLPVRSEDRRYWVRDAWKVRRAYRLVKAADLSQSLHYELSSLR